MKFGKKLLVALLASIGVVSAPALAGSSNMPLTKIDVATDHASLQRGAMIYYNECRMCHSMKFIKYRNLLEIGFDEEFVNGLRGENLMSAKLISINNDDTLTKLYGMIPPDLSLMAKARPKGPHYIYTLMTNYYEKEDGTYDNHLFPNIKMPDIFDISTVMSAEDKVVVENKTKDIVAFLNWTADPRAPERHALGVWVIGYFVLFTLLYYLLMKKVWRRVRPAAH